MHGDADRREASRWVGRRRGLTMSLHTPDIGACLCTPCDRFGTPRRSLLTISAAHSKVGVGQYIDIELKDDD